jgi:hypothetical protein
VRISVGLASNFSDAYRFVRFAAGFGDQSADSYRELAVAPQSTLRDAA